MITNLTFEELKRDTEFISGLQNGEFVLVIGAGFSYGVKNKSNTECNTIPLGKDFLNLTRSKFDSGTKKYKIAASLWKEASDSDTNISEEFKNLFLADENQFDYENFNHIFIPNWYKIYTLNFDNVLDLAQKKNERKYDVFYYPKDPSNIEQSISHLHGKIKPDFKFSDIVFSPKDYIESAKKMHSLYTPFHGDIKTFNKNIVIMGTQFEEDAVLSKFFDGLEDEEYKIYHFEFENHNTIDLPEFKKKDYKFIQLTKEGNGVYEIFRFFEDNRHLIQKFNFEGAQVIDKAFIEQLENKTFTPNDFYISKLSKDCQWYGCYKKWGIKREFYSNLKDTIISSFDEERVSNVSAVVYGAGGSGKSTQLRILALELYNERFRTIWIENFDSFNESSIKIIEKTPSQKFLIIIEDWYRLSDIYRETSNEVFKKLTTFTNVRIVIGDRTLKSIYINKLYNNKKARYQILPSENKQIIKKVASIIPEWENVCEDLFNNNSINNTSLFSILFIINNIIYKKMSSENIRLLDIKGHFAEIVKSDVKKIANSYPGLSKAIVYLANIYKKYKIRITKKALIKIASNFNPQQNYSLLNINNTDSEIDKLISNYITESKVPSRADWVSKIDFIQFNHDILAEEGLTKSILKGWSSFNEIIQLKILDILVELKDDFTASNFLKYLLDDKKSIFKNNTELKLAYVEKLYRLNKSALYFLISVLSKKSDFSFVTKKTYAIEILERFKTEKIDQHIVQLCFSVLSKEVEGKAYAIQVLERFKTENFGAQLIGKSLSVLFQEAEGRTYAIEYLERFRSENLDSQIINTCLKILSKEKKVKTYAIEILERFKTEKIDFQIINNCLSILSKDAIGKTYAIQVLERFKTEKFEAQLISKSLSVLLKETEGKTYAILFLERFRTEKIDLQIISICLVILLKENEGKTYAIEILERFKTEKIDFEIVCNCLNILKNKSEGITYAIEILERFKTEKLNYQIISNCISILLEEKEGKTYAIEILERFKTESVNGEIICNCLTILLKEKEGKTFATEILERFKTERINPVIICNCLKNLTNTNEGKTYAIEILDRFKSEKINHQIINICLATLFNEIDGKIYAIEILDRFKTKNINLQIINKCLLILRKEESLLSYANLFLNENNYKYNFGIIYQSLYNYAVFKRNHHFVNRIIEEYKKKLKNSIGKYISLLRTPFFFNDAWLAEFNFIRLNWRMLNRQFVSSILYSSYNYPEFSIDLCKEVLDRWQLEIEYQIKKNVNLNFDHIENALIHPTLERDYVILKTKEILKYNKSKGDILPEIFISKLNELLDNDTD